MENFTTLTKLGTYTNGKGYRAEERDGLKLVFVKKSSVYEDGEGVPVSILREMAFHRMMCRAPHILSLDRMEKGRTGDKQIYFCLVFEPMDINLQCYLRVISDPLPSQTIKRLMYQLCKGVASCHRMGVILRDLKPSNLLISTDTLTLKIADLALAHRVRFPIKPYLCEILTLQYCAPEALLCVNDKTEYSYGLDMWSVGCIFAELVTNKALFQGDSKAKQLQLIFRLLGTPTEAVWPGVTRFKGWQCDQYPNLPAQELSSAVPGLDSDGLDLLSKMLQYDPSKRIKALTAIDHPYFSDLELPVRRSFG